MRAGNTNSCGCLRREAGVAHGKSTKRHGEGSNGKETPEYRAWAQLRNRCTNPNHEAYKHYGARGITVCERWASYENFLADMGRRPSEFHSIDRRDNSKGYSPDNCRWATYEEQNNNTRFNRQITIRGVTKTLADWLRFTGGIREWFKRYEYRGFPEEQALLTAPRDNQGQPIDPAEQQRLDDLLNHLA